jgi:hypothetical protein
MLYVHLICEMNQKFITLRELIQSLSCFFPGEKKQIINQAAVNNIAELK